MSYMREPFYIWGDGENIHFDDLTMPEEVVEEFVAMYWADMTPEQREAARSRAVENHGGNFGCDALAEELGLPTAMDLLKKLLPPEEAKA